MEEKSIDSVNEYFKDISDLVKKIDRKEEAGLWQKAKKGDKAARERLVQMHLRLVVPTAKRFHRSGIDLMDLIEEGNLGLLQAIDKFDPTRGYRFSTYAIHWIEQYIRRAVEEQSGAIKIPSHAWDNLRAWTKNWEEFKLKFGREPSLQEMAARMNLSARQVRSILDTLSAAYSVDSLSSAVNEEDGALTLEDTLTDYGKGNPDDLVTNSSSNTALLNILGEISPRDKEVLIMRFGLNSAEPYTLADVAKKMNISRERVRQIEERAVRNVRKKAQELGLFEEKEKDHSTKNIHTGMKLKTNKNILGQEVLKNNLLKLLKTNAGANARAAKLGAKKPVAKSPIKSNKKGKRK
ncbi:MAG: sigma-70 family RNA polymerase sigma factor [Elusimicrobiota bacterium]|jgi:RNA polymerase primary sigma factor|nr:sigma-70 family RNA polymerase sigma factor [Elusimicrobiota bacterium]